MLTSIIATHGWGDGPGPWILVFPLFWLTVLALAVVWFRRRGPFWRQPSTGRSVLDERYARGEISADEYRERLEVLEGDRR